MAVMLLKICEALAAAGARDEKALPRRGRAGGVRKQLRQIETDLAFFKWMVGV
jgi:hypothetical protein